MTQLNWLIFMIEFIAQRKPLGGLLFLLPQMLNFENRDPTSESKYQIHEKKLIKNVLVELERLLIYANIPVSEKK